MASNMSRDEIERLKKDLAAAEPYEDDVFDGVFEWAKDENGNLKKVFNARYLATMAKEELARYYGTYDMNKWI